MFRPSVPAGKIGGERWFLTPHPRQNLEEHLYLFLYFNLFQDMLCFSGGGMLNIKASNFPVHQQKLQV